MNLRERIFEIPGRTQKHGKARLELAARDSCELVDWISELGYPKDVAAYGEARRKLASFSPEDEVAAKLSRTYDVQTGSDTPLQAPPHHEHSGFVLVSCERADLKLSPKGITAYDDTERRFLGIAPPMHPGSEVLTEFVSAVLGERVPVHDGRWGLETTACCAALLESSRSRRELAPAAIIDQAMKKKLP